MSTLLRSRQPIRFDECCDAGSSDSSPQHTLLRGGGNNDEKCNKGSAKAHSGQTRVFVALLTCLLCWLLMFDNVGSKRNVTLTEGENIKKASMGDIVYGAKSKGGDTSRFVKEAIQAGFRHIATGGFHFEYNEAGVGQGWKESGVPREELYLQTLFLSQTTQGYATENCLLENECPPSSDLTIEDQVRLSVRSSLHNLQTDYIDAVLIHNFRAKLQPYEETMKAWRVLEDYVEKGVVRHLGIVSVHDKEYLTKLHSDARIKPSIIQNRFHSNRGYDIDLRPTFHELGITHNQLFWVLTGSAGGKVRNNDVVKRVADKKGVSPQVLLYSFTMQLGGSPLIGSKSSVHMKEDVDELVRNRVKWETNDLMEMAGVLNKNLMPQLNTPEK